ncbi:hypothetical protein GCM10027176_50400 [Actinoallomurus bryophytorum]|uniref:hypothetical protein n=1 Tax=Actinoallomurus bryophytorum TaxID=1490222 RepID=UPI0011506C68|nr:hypothetical protein [Actinoallomurus bryophytorum]
MLEGPPPAPSYDIGAPSSKRRAVALVLALAALVAVVIAVAGVTGDDPPSVKTAHEAGRNLTKTAALALNGTYAGGHAMFTVTRAGTARGSYTAGAGQVARIDVGGRTYLKADSRFWKASGRSSAVAARADGAWTTAPYDAVELSLGDLSPSRLGQNLREAADDLPVRRTTLNGVKAIRLTTAGSTYFLSRSESPRVLRVQGDGFSFDVTPLPSSATDIFFSTLRKEAGDLEGAYDPDVSFPRTAGRTHFGTCRMSGCTAEGRVEPDARGGRGPIQVVTTVDFRAPTGAVISRCSDSATSTKPRIAFSCRTGGTRWASWYRSHHGRSGVRAYPRFGATVNSAEDVSHLLTLLAREQQTG